MINMKSKTASEAKYLNDRWYDIAHVIVKEITSNEVIKNISMNVIEAGYSFFKLVIYDESNFNKMKNSINEFGYSPKIVNEYKARGFYYIHVLFNIE